MKDSGTAMLGVGVSSSKNRAEEAAEQATLAPLIGSSIQSATGVVYNITGGKDITLQEVNRVSQVRVFGPGLLGFASIGYIPYYNAQSCHVFGIFAGRDKFGRPIGQHHIWSCCG